MKDAVLVLDMTNDSIAQGARSLEQRKKILGQTAAFLAWARGKGRPIVHICSSRRKTDKWFLKYWEAVNMVGSPGQAPIPQLYDAASDTIVHKRRYSGFFASDLDVTLREMDVTTLTLLGWSTSLAVLNTSLDAWQLGYPTTIVSDLTVAHAWGNRSMEDNQQWSLDFMKAFAMSTITTSAELMR
jgi:ureidoacrylate peracid hydrolase